MESGQAWAYRARQVDELVEVKVLRLGTQRPARVLVRFVDDAFEGREEWVPPARLKVPWDNVGDYRAREDRWERIREAGVSDDDPKVDAAESILEMLLSDEERAQLVVGHRGQGGCVGYFASGQHHLYGLPCER